MKEIKLVKKEFGYNFWKGKTEYGEVFYNVTPEDQPSPNGGYMSAEYICKIKNVPNCFV